MSGEHGYQLLERIGLGGMAEVYRANALGAEGFERPIAIKRILPHLAEDEDFVKMFIDEAKIAVQLSHPNIVGIFDLGRFGNDYFIAMELVHGRDLRQIQDREAQLGRRLPLEIALHAAMKVCEALHHAHFKGGGSMMGEPVFIIHRDVSPQNVLVSYDGQVKVTDFGLAKAAGRRVETQAGIIKGKLAYMSPEQLTSVPIDQRSDIFAAGTLLWEMLTGTRLFLGANDRETIQNVFAAQVQSPRRLDPQIPVELDRVVMRALAKDRDQRYQTAQEFHDELEEAAYAVHAMINAPSVSAYMRALFPEAEVSGQQRKRDPRAATAEIRLTDIGGPARVAAPYRQPVADELEELDDAEMAEELDDDDVHPEPDSMMPPAFTNMLEDAEDGDDGPVGDDDPEESRKTIPPLDLVTPSPDAMLPPAARTDPGDAESSLRSTSVEGRRVAQESGARAVMPNLHAPTPIISAQQAPAPIVPPVQPPRPHPYAAFVGDDDYEDQTVFGAPGFDTSTGSESGRATLDVGPEALALAAQMLEPLGDVTTGGNRLPPEELLTTKAHAPSGELLARARGEAQPQTARSLPAAPEEAPSARDTIPPPDSYDDRTVVGGITGQVPPDPFAEWEDETTPVGDERPKGSRTGR